MNGNAQPTHASPVMLLAALFSTLLHDIRTSADRWIIAGCAIALFAATFGTYAIRIDASRSAIQVNNCILGADTATYARGLDQGLYRGLKPRKHPAVVVSVQMAASPLVRAGLSPRDASTGALALIQATGATAMFLFLARNISPPLNALLLTTLFLSWFGPATLFSIVETYGTTFAISALALLLMGELARNAPLAPVFAGALAGVAALAAGLSNPPALAILPAGLGLLSVFHQRGSAAVVVRYSMAAVLVAALGMLVPGLIVDGLEWHRTYAERYASLALISAPRVAADYVAGFLLFSLVAPADHVQCRFLASAILSGGPPVRIMAAGLNFAVLAAAIWRSARNPGWRSFTAFCLGGVACLFVFYAWFNPDEVLLYSPQWLLLLALAAAAGMHGRWQAMMMGSLLLLNLVLNLSPLAHGRSHDPLACCPSPPSTMLHREMPSTLAQSRNGCAIEP